MAPTFLKKQILPYSTKKCCALNLAKFTIFHFKKNVLQINFSLKRNCEVDANTL